MTLLPLTNALTDPKQGDSDEVVAECSCCDRLLPGRPGAGGSAHICNECGR